MMNPFNWQWQIDNEVYDCFRMDKSDVTGQSVAIGYVLDLDSNKTGQMFLLVAHDNSLKYLLKETPEFFRGIAEMINMTITEM